MRDYPEWTNEANRILRDEGLRLADSEEPGWTFSISGKFERVWVTDYGY
jgi:hypothetical protein